MSRRAISPEQWSSFLDSFTGRHRDWLVTVEVTTGGATRSAGEARPLRSIGLEPAEGIVIETGDPEPSFLRIQDPSAIHVFERDPGEVIGLEIASPTATTSVRFRTAVAPELVDGIQG